MSECADASNTNENWKDNIWIPPEKAAHDARFINLLQSFQEIWDEPLGQINTAANKVELSRTEARPIHALLYGTGPKARESEKDEIDKMLVLKIIEPARTEKDSRILFVTKKDGTLRNCIDYRKRNAVTTKESCLLPRVDECGDSLGDAKILSPLDAMRGYWQIEVHENDRSKTAFFSHHGLEQFTRRPFGLHNAPATFQHTMDVILSIFNSQYALVYLDGIVICSSTPGKQIKQTGLVSRLLKNASVALNLQNCAFFTNTVDRLVHIIRPG